MRYSQSITCGLTHADELSVPRPENIQRLVQAQRHVMNRIPQDIIPHLVRRMRQRLTFCISAAGADPILHVATLIFLLNFAILFLSY